MDPVSLAVSVGMTAVSAGVSAYGKYEAGQAASAQATYQAGVAQQLAKIADINANYDVEEGEIKARQQGERGLAERAGAKVRAAAANISVNTGSPAKVGASINEIAMQNQDIERADAAHAAYSERVKGATQRAQAGLYQMAAATDIEAGDIGAIGSIVGGAASVADKWQQAQQVGLTGGSGSAPTLFPDPNNPGQYAIGYG